MSAGRRCDDTYPGRETANLRGASRRGHAGVNDINIKSDCELSVTGRDILSVCEGLLYTGLSPTVSRIFFTMPCQPMSSASHACEITQPNLWSSS